MACIQINLLLLTCLYIIHWYAIFTGLTLNKKWLKIKFSVIILGINIIFFTKYFIGLVVWLWLPYFKRLYFFQFKLIIILNQSRLFTFHNVFKMSVFSLSTEFHTCISRYNFGISEVQRRLLLTSLWVIKITFHTKTKDGVLNIVTPATT
jgi:heme/copper-type cytochrome/quinol oxidase subunit 1